MHVVVAIVSFRNPEDVARCLSALERSTHESFEVIVCENGGPAAYSALAAALPTQLKSGQRIQTMLAEGNTGFAGGVNRCLAATKTADAWWILNPDTEVSPEAMAAMVERLGSGAYDAVGSTVAFPNGVVQAHGGRWSGWLAAPHSIGFGSNVSRPPDPLEIERQQNYLLGTSMMVSRRFVETVGPMDASYFLYCEEVEWCLRAQKRGMRLGFAVGAVVMHLNGTTTGAGAEPRERPRLPVYLAERNKILVTKDCFPTRLPVAIVGAIALPVFRCLRRGAWRQIVYSVAGWWAGLAGERGQPAWSST